MNRAPEILIEILNERTRQDEKWGEQNHPDYSRFAHALGRDREAADWKTINDRRAKFSRLSWDGILLEEVYEALAESDPAALRAELIQVAAVAAAWAEAIDRRPRETEAIAS